MEGGICELVKAIHERASICTESGVELVGGNEFAVRVHWIDVDCHGIANVAVVGDDEILVWDVRT